MQINLAAAMLKRMTNYLSPDLHPPPIIGLHFGVLNLFRSLKSYCEQLATNDLRRVSTILRQVLAKFSEFFMCWVFDEEISRQDRLATTIANSVDPQHPHFCLPSRAFRCLFPPEAVPDWKPVC
jgi:hypothetical protein